MATTTPGQRFPLLTETAVTRPSDGVVDEEGRAEPPIAADERGTLLGFLEFQRATLHWKCSGLDADQLQARVAASTMTLGGIVKHLSWVEDYWFTEVLRGVPMPEPWQSVDWRADHDWEWTSSAADAPGELFTLWQESVGRSRKAVEAASDLGAIAARGWPDGQEPNVRWILVHMIEEYARHNGHADLIRESIDGATGE